MHVRKKERAFSVLEAVDNLSLFAELRTSMKKAHPETDLFQEEQPIEHISKRSWQDPDMLSLNIQKARQTFSILYAYLKDLYENEEKRLRDADLQKGVQAMVVLAMEAASNLELYFEQIDVAEAVTDWEEYQELIQFYQNVIAPKLSKQFELVEQWQEEWGIGTESDGLKPGGIEDIEMVRRDRDYELFLIRREDGRPFFNRSLLRHIYLIKQFDELLVMTPDEDPLSKLHFVQDAQMQSLAKGILHAAHTAVDDFYKRGVEHKGLSLVFSANKMIMALMLAANVRNSLQTTSGKTCLNYFQDFQHFFRALLLSKEYQQLLVTAPPASERLAHSILQLTQTVAAALFTQKRGSEEISSLLKTVRQKGEEGFDVEREAKSPVALWNTLLDEDEAMRYALKRSHFGPLNKAIIHFRTRSERAFDPLLQGNLPHVLFMATIERVSIPFLHLPCPTVQATIKRAEVSPEFHLFLRTLQEKDKRHLIINLQDRTSWQEQARCTALEELSQTTDALTVVTLATGTDFYLQSGAFAQREDAEDFIEAFVEQIEKRHGFFFPKEIPLHKTLRAIHVHFFSGKRGLSHKNRLDFIEIAYLLLSLRCIEHLRPHSVSFTSKDSIDSGAAKSAEMYAFLAIAQKQGAWSDADKDFFRILLYASALQCRERVIDAQTLRRAFSALCVLNAEPAKLKPLLAA